jgi:hypothetical protein
VHPRPLDAGAQARQLVSGLRGLYVLLPSLADDSPLRKTHSSLSDRGSAHRTDFLSSVSPSVSIAALHTVPGYRGASLAHHTVTHLASLLLAAFSFLPPDLRLAYPGQEATNDNGELWLVADFNHGNPAGEGFFTSQGFERLEEAVRWSKGRM